MSIASFVTSFANTVQPPAVQSFAETSTPAFSDVFSESVEGSYSTHVPDFLFNPDMGSDDEFSLWEEFDDRATSVFVDSSEPLTIGQNDNLPSGDDVQPEARLLAVSSAEGRQLQLQSPRRKRQTTDNRPVNIFGLGFGTNQRPGQGQQQATQDGLRPLSSVSNQDVAFDQENFEDLLENNVKDVLDSAMNQLQANPDELAKGVDKFKMRQTKTGNDAATTTEAPATTYEPTKTIISRYPDLIFHPDMTDLLMLIIGLLFSSIFFPGLIGFLACFVRLDQLPFVLLPRPTLNGRAVMNWLESWWH